MLKKDKSASFGDHYLYENDINLISVNGQLVNNNIYHDDECLLPILHAAVSDKNYDKAFEVCEVGLLRYKEQTMLTQIFKTKINMLERLMELANHGAQTASKVITDTLVILGNGPSLKYVMGNPAYRAILKKYDTFGLNAAYRAYDELDFWPTYHGCLDMIVVESHLENYRNILPKLKMMFLLSEDHLGNDIVNFEHPNLTKIRFDQRYRDSNEKIISERFDQFRNWQNSGCNCVQIGLMLGYKRVVLLGMDANYKEVLNEADVTRDDKYRWDHLQITKEVTSNDNYWFSGYQQVGDKYNIPNANKYHLPAWNALGLSDHKDKIVNCTTETKITTITRRSFEEIFNVKPCYLPIRDEYRLKSINPSPENLIGRVISINGLLFCVTEEEEVIVRRFIPETVFSDLIKNCQNILILDGDESLLNIPCHGVVNNFAEIPREFLSPGLTFMIRAKNEQDNIKFVLGSLKNILSNKELRCQLLFVDNNSSDDTYNEVVRVCEEQGISNVLLTSYNVDVCRSGEAHAALTNDQMHRSLDTYYNWCLDRVMTNYVIKWDCDFLALQANLIQLINEYELHSSNKPLAIWCTGKTLFKSGESYFVNESTMYNEFRIFSKSHGYRWQYAPRWEICSQQYMASADKRIFGACVFLELKDLDKNEFEFRSHGAAITSDVRDRRDAEIMALIQSGNDDLIPPNLNRLGFNPLAPTNFNSSLLQGYEATLEELDALQSYWLNVYSRPQNHFRFAHKGNAVIQGLWVGEQVTNFHRLCIESFLRNGHCYVLYTYGPVGNLPEGVVIKDANKIVPSTLIYQYDGSYAGFSDLFRNKLLFDNGGWYVDLDIYCLRPFDIDSEIMFSLDYYHQDAIKARLGTDSIVDDRYYVQTNPCKLPAGHDMARSMYATIFKKIVFERIKSVWLGNQTEATESLLKGEVESNQIISALDKLQIVGDFETFVGKLSKLPNKCSFYKLLDTYNVALKDVGQKTWGEIGPIMVTREVVSRGLERYTTKPEMFQGVVKYFEIENFVDRGFDYRTRLQEANPYSLDLFFTMWRRKGLLDKFDTTEDCLLKHIRDLVKEKLDD